MVDADEEGGFVEYTWDDPSTDEDVNPRVCYAIKGGHPALPPRNSFWSVAITTT